MKPVLFAAAAVLLATGQTCAKDDAGQWVTFKTGHDNYGPIEHQIDRTSIRRAGPYFTFQTRIWARQMKQPITINEALFYWSQTFAVDCAHHRFGAQFIDSNLPAEARHKATFETMRWEDLDKAPAVGPAVCGR